MRSLLITACLFVALLCSGTAMADPVLFSFTGFGVNGSSASGTFTVDETALAPGYFATGSIYSSFSLTIANIPGPGPASFSAGLAEFGSTWLQTDPFGIVHISPYGGIVLDPQLGNNYSLGQPNQPPGSYDFDSILYYNGEHGPVDHIYWSTASRASSSVPEAGSTVVYLLLASVALGVRFRRRRVAA